MTPEWQEATEDDIPAILALLRDDALGATREDASDEVYLAAFRRMRDEAANHLIVGRAAAGIVATYQITFIQGLSLAAARRAQIESVRVATAMRGRGIGALLMADAERRARAAGCALIQLTTNAARARTHEFYLRHGYGASHLGLKKALDRGTP